MIPYDEAAGLQEKEVPSAQEQGLNPSGKDPSPRSLTVSQQRRQLNRDKRYGLYEQVKELRTRGLSHDAIADTLGISRPTVRRFLEAEQFPERVERPKTKPKNHVVAPYLSFLSERWQAGCHNGRQLFREAKARGYSGSRAQLERVTTEWRKHLPPSEAAKERKPLPAVASPPKMQQLSPQQVSWVFVIDKAQLTAEQQHQIEQICGGSSELARAYRLCQDFAEMLQERKAQDLRQWLGCAKASQIPELQGLAKSMQQDYPAIYAAWSQPWSQGQVEGRVNRLKCIKRQLYGRANFDLLRRRVLLAI